jgi:hypothetical protein
MISFNTSHQRQDRKLRDPKSKNPTPSIVWYMDGMLCFLGLALTGSLLAILLGAKRWEGRKADGIMKCSDPGMMRS